MGKLRVLFVCIHNSARSQMAEAILNHFYSDRFYAESAGFETGKLNPFAVKAMSEIGIDISANRTKKVFDFFKEGRFYSYVITVCDEASAERCPIFPGVKNTLHWSFPDPSVFEGSDEEKLSKTIGVRDEIRLKINEWISKLSD
ncbi:MAG: arsenate reductase ArsC [Ignavibacteria bacterium]|nr:arsenate reductase ArsC [Ignavibacteria bacterium]